MGNRPADKPVGNTVLGHGLLTFQRRFTYGPITVVLNDTEKPKWIRCLIVQLMDFQRFYVSNIVYGKQYALVPER